MIYHPSADGFVCSQKSIKTFVLCKRIIYQNLSLNWIEKSKIYLPCLFKNTFRKSELWILICWFCERYFFLSIILTRRINIFITQTIYTTLILKFQLNFRLRVDNFFFEIFHHIHIPSITKMFYKKNVYLQLLGLNVKVQ